jgi:hypothetical protein
MPGDIQFLTVRRPKQRQPGRDGVVAARLDANVVGRIADDHVDHRSVEEAVTVLASNSLVQHLGGQPALESPRSRRLTRSLNDQQESILPVAMPASHARRDRGEKEKNPSGSKRNGDKKKRAKATERTGFEPVEGC